MRYPRIEEVIEAARSGTVYKNPMYGFIRQFPVFIWEKYLPLMEADAKKWREDNWERVDREFQELLDGKENTRVTERNQESIGDNPGAEADH